VQQAAWVHHLLMLACSQGGGRSSWTRRLQQWVPVHSHTMQLRQQPAPPCAGVGPHQGGSQGQLQQELGLGLSPLPKPHRALVFPSTALGTGS
jgi:hypothetical protein